MTTGSPLAIASAMARGKPSRRLASNSTWDVASKPIFVSSLTGPKTSTVLAMLDAATQRFKSANAGPLPAMRNRPT